MIVLEIIEMESIRRASEHNRNKNSRYWINFGIHNLFDLNATSFW
jgi:hypothetical protein